MTHQKQNSILCGNTISSTHVVNEMINVISSYSPVIHIMCCNKMLEFNGVKTIEDIPNDDKRLVTTSKSISFNSICLS